MSAKSTSKQDMLMAALKNSGPASAPAAMPEVAQSHPGVAETPLLANEPKAPKKKKGGKNVHFFLHDEDSRLIRELAAWLSGQGERPNDSLVIRTAIRTVKTDASFHKAYKEALQADGRLKRHRSGI